MPTTKEFDDSWKEWIRLNRSRGCDIDGIFRILVDHGFDYDQVRDELGCEPTKPLDQIENPLAGENQTDDSFLEFYLPNKCASLIEANQEEVEQQKWRL